MDDLRFDNLIRSLATPSRRAILRRLTGVALGSLLIPAVDVAAANDLTAKCKKFKGDKKKKCLKKARKRYASNPDPCTGGQCVDPGPVSCATNGTCAHGSACTVDNDCQSNVCGSGVCCSGACVLNNATAMCEPETGRCFLSCNAGWGNCFGEGNCETSLVDNPQHCGDCGNDCSVGCEPGQVGSCQGDTCICQ